MGLSGGVQGRLSGPMQHQELVTDTMWVLAVIAGAVGECPVH